MRIIKKSFQNIANHGGWKLVSIIGRIPYATQIMQRVFYSYFNGPTSVKIHITNKCNYGCVYCYSEKYCKDPVSIPEWLQFIDELDDYNINTIEISGGEPFLEEGIFDILKKCSDNNYQVSIFTNGSVINKDIIKRIKSYNTEVIISVKYDSPYNYNDKTKSNVRLRKVENNIRMLVDSGIPVVAFITVTKDNVKHINEIINNSISLGMFPLVERYAPIKNKEINEKLSITNKEWHRVTKMIMGVYSYYDALIEGISMIQGGICSCFKTQVSIMQTGDVLPCQFLPLEMSIGNIKRETFKDIWRKVEAKRVEWNRLPEECSSCKSRVMCNGGCKLGRYLNGTDKNSKDELCSLNLPTTYGHCAFSVIHSLNGKNVKNDKLLRV